MLDVPRLRVLREVCRHGSFSAAAHALHLTQPAVSRQVARLESETGLRLVERGPPATPTEAGTALLARAEAILAEVAAAEEELAALRGLESGRLRVASFPSGGPTLVVDAVASFRRAHPGVDVEFRDAGHAKGLALVRAGELDVALVFSPVGHGPTAEGVRLVHLLRDPMLVALPAGHRLAGRRRLRLEELADDPWLAGTSPELTRASCRAAGFEPRLVGATDHARTSHALVAAGVGVTLVTGLGLAFPTRGLAVRPLADPGLARDVYAAVRAGSAPVPTVDAFVEHLRRAARRRLGPRRSTGRGRAPR
jgi:DNA-binding transcriptional LysR family regulator